MIKVLCFIMLFVCGCGHDYSYEYEPVRMYSVEDRVKNLERDARESAIGAR